MARTITALFMIFFLSLPNLCLADMTSNQVNSTIGISLSIKKKMDSNNNERYENNNLIADDIDHTSNWEKTEVIAQVFTAIVGIASVIIILYSLHLNRKAVNAAIQSNYSEWRPKLEIRRININALTNKLTGTFQVNNIGGYSSRVTHMVSHFAVYDDGLPSIPQHSNFGIRYKHKCDYLVKPNDWLYVNEQNNKDIAIPDYIFKQSEFSEINNRIKHLYLIVIVDYALERSKNDNLHDRTHRTAFCRQLHWTGNSWQLQPVINSDYEYKT